MFNRFTKTLGHKAIALIRALRGCVLLAVGFSLWQIVRTDGLQDMKNRIQALAQNLDEPIISWVLVQVNQTSDQQVLFFALLVTIFAILRFTESVGVWYVKRWGEVISLITSLTYIPLVAMALTYGFNLLVFGLLVLNICIAVYLFLALQRKNSPPLTPNKSIHR
jgi:uncharacterized membrane protein (DUF2068 family)